MKCHADGRKHWEIREIPRKPANENRSPRNDVSCWKDISIDIIIGMDKYVLVETREKSRWFVRFCIFFHSPSPWPKCSMNVVRLMFFSLLSVVGWRRIIKSVRSGHVSWRLSIRIVQILNSHTHFPCMYSKYRIESEKGACLRILLTRRLFSMYNARPTSNEHQCPIESNGWFSMTLYV